MDMKNNETLPVDNQAMYDPDSIIRDLFRQWWVILLAALTAALLAGTYLKISYVPIYSTTTTFVVEKSGFSNNSVSDNLRSAENMAENFSVITESSLLKKRVCEDLGISSFNSEVQVTYVESSNLMTMTVISGTPRMSYLTCLSVMECAQELCEELSENISVRVLQQPSLPSRPSNPLQVKGPMRKAALAAAAAMAAVFVLLSFYKDTVKNEQEMNKKVDAPLLASVCHEKTYRTMLHRLKRKKNSLCLDNLLLSFDYVESIRLMATRIRQAMDKNHCKTVMVTSVSENEGKSTIAANLAMALVQEGCSVALLDCDFRKPSQYKIFDLKDQKDSIVDFNDMLRQKKDFKLQPAGRDQKLMAAFGTSSHMRTLDQNTFSFLGDILHQLKEQMDYVIIDSSPLGLVAEGEILANLADASVLVVQQDVMEARYINDMVDQLNHTRSKLLGCVYNNVRPGIISRAVSYGHYGYGYHYYGYGHYGYGRYHYGSYEKNRKHTKTDE